MGQLAQLRNVDSMVSAVMAAPGSPISRTDVDQHVFDVLRIRVLQHRHRVTAQREHGVSFVPRRKPARELKTRVEEDAQALFELGFGPTSDNYQSHKVSLSRFARRSGTPSLTMSSTGASRIACTEPKCRRRARLRAGPMPSTESSGDVSALRERTLR